MSLIDSSVFFYPRGNLSARLVKPFNYPTDFTEAVGTFYQKRDELTYPKCPELRKPCQGYTKNL